MLIWGIYLFSIYNKIAFYIDFATLFMNVVSLFLLTAVVVSLFNRDIREEIEPALKVLRKPFLFLVITLNIIHAALPSPKYAYAMVSVYAAEQVIEDPAIKPLFDKAVWLLHRELDKAMDSSGESQ